MLSHINRNTIEELRKLRLDLPHLRLLEIFISDIGGKEEDTLAYQTLERKGYIVDEQVTDMGIELYNNLKLLNGDKEVKVKTPRGIKMQLSEEFEEWWKVFPSSDRFTIIDNTGKTRLFSGIRKLNPKKAECKELFLKYILSGKYTAEQMITGTLNHIETVKRESLKKNENKLSFVPNSLRYLKEECFSPFMDIKLEEKKESSYDGVVDI